MGSNLFIKNIITNNASQGLQFGARWIFNITLINVLDITTYGLFSFVYTISNMLLAVLPFGSSVYLINEVKNFESDVKKLLDSFIIAFALTAALLITYIILSPFLAHLKGWEYYGYGIALGFILSLNISLFSFYKGLGNFMKELKAYGVFFLLLLGLVGFVFFLPKGLKDIPFIFLVLISINSLVFVGTLLSSNKLRNAFNREAIKGSILRIKNAFRERTYFGFQEIVTALYTQSGMLLLFYLLDTATYGYYRALFVIIAPLLLITVSFSQVMLNYIKNVAPNVFLTTFRKIQGYSLAIGCFLVLIFYVLKGFLFEVIKVPENETTTLAFTTILGAILIRFMFTNYEMILVVIDKQKQRFFIVLGVAFINIALIFALLPKYGLIGAVSTNLFTYLVLLIGLFIFTENALKKQKS